MSDELRAAEALAALRSIASDQIEYKAGIEAPALSVDGREVTTLFSVDCLDLQDDITPVSAFNKSINERPERIPHIYMHDLMNPALARILSFLTVNRDELPEDVRAEHPDATSGKACVSRYLTTHRADEVFEGIKAGIPYGASFGYRALNTSKKQLANGKTARVLHEVQLFEVSTVPPGHAANPATRTRLGKAAALLAEMKAGRRHSRSDIELLREIARMAYELGADNIELIQEAIEQAAEEAEAAPSAKRTRTEHAARVLSGIEQLIGRTS